jgi:hypothetical protein
MTGPAQHHTNPDDDTGVAAADRPRFNDGCHCDAKNGATTANERSRAANDHTPNHRADHPRRHRHWTPHWPNPPRAERPRPELDRPPAPTTISHTPRPTVGHEPDSRNVIEQCDPVGPNHRLAGQRCRWNRPQRQLLAKINDTTSPGPLLGALANYPPGWPTSMEINTEVDPRRHQPAAIFSKLEPEPTNSMSDTRGDHGSHGMIMVMPLPGC